MVAQPSDDRGARYGAPADVRSIASAGDRIRAAGLERADAAPDVSLIELLVRTAAGSVVDFTQLYARLSPGTFALILAIVAEREAAERTLTEVFLEVWNAAPTFDPAVDDAAEWVLLISRRRAVDSVREQRPSPTFVEILRRLRSVDRP